MAKKVPQQVSGFPEWLPEARIVEMQWIDTMRQVFESFGFCSIDPCNVEDVSVIAAKGEDVDKEIYGLARLNGGPEAGDPRLALHFDLTVPMARYVAQNYSNLVFPFKRYQIQKAWRGERPQEGRYREFLQADIDVVDNGTLSIQFDAEMPRIVHKIFSKLGLDNIQTNMNNRKIVQGFYTALGIADPMPVLRAMDKIEKIGAPAVVELLTANIGLAPDVADKCIALAQVKTADGSFKDRIRALGVTSPLMEEGMAELDFVMNSLSDLPKGSVIANLSIARGLDYYTGTVYEAKLADYPGFPTIFAGGRYENLVGQYLNKPLPGVGISIGISRIFGKMLKEGRIDLQEKSPTSVLVMRLPGHDLGDMNRKAEHLRNRGINVEVYHRDAKVGDQIRYAERKGTPYVLFTALAPGRDEIKDIRTGVQFEVDLNSWAPSAADQSYRTAGQPSTRRSVLPIKPV